MRSRAPLLALTLLTLSAAGCGGSTTDATGQVSQGAGGTGAAGAGVGGSTATGGAPSAGGHAGQATGGSSSTGGASVGGSSSTGGASSVGGSSSTGGSSSVGGSSSAGGSSVGGSSSTGGSSAGGASSTGGSTSSGGSSGTGGSSSVDWKSCAAAGDCMLAWNSCCGTCGMPAAKDYDAVDYVETMAHFTDVCPGGGGACPDCAQFMNYELAAFCEMSVCQVVTIDEHPISSCITDDDCGIRKADCCDCGETPPGQLIAIRKDATLAYESQVCGHGNSGCPTDCAPQHPAGYGAVCDKATSHCAVVPINAGPTCPATVPTAMTPCTLPAGQECEYGSDVRISCRTHATCENGSWSIPLTGCPPLPPPGTGGCPASAATAPPSCPVASSGLVCDFGGGSVCECVQCGFGACMPTNPGQWECSTTPQGCPETANVGQPCPVEGQSCQYGFPCSSDGAGRTCTGGVWTDTPQPCPG